MIYEFSDHLSPTARYYSFADGGIAGLECSTDNYALYVQTVEQDLQQRSKQNKRSLAIRAAEMGIADQHTVKELTELAIVNTAREIAQIPGRTVAEKFNRLVELYHDQVNLSHRSSQSILLQQYSTPAPIGYLMGIFCGIDQLHQKGGYAFEPSAGNGLLTVAADPQRVYVNEVDTLRRKNLAGQGFAGVWNRDAAMPFFDVRHHFTAVLTNPPFGQLDTPVSISGYPIRSLEHLMAIYALDTMVSSGKAAIIIGGHTGWDDKGRIKAGKNRLFFNYLYHHYHVAAVIQLNGKQLYTRQGTGFNTRLILISGRKEKPGGVAPVYDQQKDTVTHSFEALFQRVVEAMQTAFHQDMITDKTTSTIHQNVHDAMNSEAQRLLQALRAKPLGESGTEDNQYAMAYTEYYLPLLDYYNHAIVFLRNGDYYEVYGKDTSFIKHLLPDITLTTFLCDSIYVGYITLDEEAVAKLTVLFRSMGVRFILTDSTEASYPVTRVDTGIAATLLWEITLEQFLQAEEQHYRQQVQTGQTYELPYKTEYVLLFNTLSGADIYKPHPANPYTHSGYRQLSQSAFRKRCLQIIHSYNVRLAMAMDIVISEPVLKDYPALKLKQDAKITYLKTIVHSGNRLNGSAQPFVMLPFDTFLQVCRDVQPLFAIPQKETLQGDEDETIVDHDALFEQFKEHKARDKNALYLFETPGTFVAFDEDAEVLAKTCNIGIIKMSANRAFKYFIAGSSKALLFARIAVLQDAGYNPVCIDYQRYHADTLTAHVDSELSRLLRQVSEQEEVKDKKGLGAPYQPSSNACIVLDTQVPDSMAFETHEALAAIKQAVGGDTDNFVRDRLGYPTKTALCKALSAEQTDAVMMAIYNVEARGQGMIIGDQTGIGKGRVAAAMIRYSCHQGMKPVFLTEKANLFSDLYRDLYAIGSGHLRPFIVNGRESKTDIKDEDGQIIYQAMPYSEQAAIMKTGKLPAGFDFAVATYSQFNSPEKKPEKPSFLQAIARDTLFIMDESHNSSGTSNTGNFLQGVIAQASGVVYLSATFAKRPDNMPIYAAKTAISDCNMSRDQLVEAIQRGGVALQEVLSSQLVAEGQMIRRERSFEGVEVNYISLQEQAQEHAAIADNITGIIRDIISFQKDFIDTIVEELDTIAVAEGKGVDRREGTGKAGVDNTPYFSKVFNIINQMLFSIKAAAVAERAIERLKEGKKPVIAFSSTMGSFLEDMTDEKGLPVSDGSVIVPDFSEVLRKGLDGVMRYTEKDVNGTPIYKTFEITELPPEAQAVYNSIRKRIEEIATGISISPIDVVIQKIKAAGYTVAEVTGRKYELQWLEADNPLHDILPENSSGNRKQAGAVMHKAIVALRKKLNTNDAFREFNNNETDVLLINQSGSTGASAHAIATSKVAKDKVRQRVMIVLQAELDINTEVQKRGRINRTGQLLKPIYDYMTSAIPAELRLMMMLQKKLKSLDANTASNQKQSSKILDVPDFLNKYGDRVVKEYLLENPAINRMLDDPLRLKDTTDSDGGEAQTLENAAHKVSGRVAVLSVKMQQEFYAEITERYNDYVAYMQQIGEYDLEMEAMNLEAETVNSKIVKVGSGSGSVFSEDSILETVQANVLRKPFTATELDNLLKEALQGEDADKIRQDIIRDYNEETAMAADIEEKELSERYSELHKRIPLEKKFQRLKTDAERTAYYENRTQQLEEAHAKALKQLREKAAARKFYLEKLFRFFYIGRNLSFPVNNGSGYAEYVPTVFLGFVIDWKRKNPFLPSKIKLRFALANSNKYFAIPASFDDIDKIIGASAELPKLTQEQILHNWGTYIQQNNADRKTRHIVTGNLLQAFSDFRGKLVNYTTIDGKIEKGILLPDNWVMDEQVQDKVSIPVIKALPLIKSITTGHSIVTTTGIGFVRQPDNYKIIVPMSRKVAGDIYLDKDLLGLVNGNNFNRVADRMVAQLPLHRIDDFISIIQDRHTCSVMVSRYQFNQMEKQTAIYNNRKPIRPPGEEKEHPDDEMESELLQLEAEALKLTLRLKLRLTA
ncbi:hypothetical protein CAP35_01265 [Chitinophagaceae bacterium IBVUCB1]|nr:hypothetical protein CAP35_01265 [Chitinophagaceae bacterium IBVUCB1]